MIGPALVVLAKAPVAGQVKTRLAATFGPLGALAVYHALLAATARAIAGWPGRILLLTSGDEGAFDGTPLASLPRAAQVEGGLGARLAAAFAAVSLPAIAIGADCPTLAPAHLAGLAAALAPATVAIGPAGDGGYWGIGLSEPAQIASCCADDLPWSQPTLLAQTQARLRARGIAVALGDQLDDLDDERGLRRAEAAGFTWRGARR